MRRRIGVGRRLAGSTADRHSAAAMVAVFVFGGTPIQHRSF
jgi:hypothetical protein